MEEREKEKPLSPFPTDRNMAPLPVTGGLDPQNLVEAVFPLNAPQPKLVYPLKNFEAHSSKHPDAIAVVFEHEHMTYQELNWRANQLGHYLQRMGVRPEKIVGVCLDRSCDLVLGILGVIKAGGCVLPLEPAYPRNRIAYMLENGKPSLVLTQRRHLGLFDNSSGTPICLDASYTEFASESSKSPKSRVRVGNLHVVLYTSGSTGYPKGVMETHTEPSQSTSSDNKEKNPRSYALPLGVEDRLLVKCPISFGPFFWELLEPLSVGASLVLARPGGEQDFHYLVRLIAEEQVTISHFVPSSLKVFLDQPEVELCRSLQHVGCSGEILPDNVRHRFFSCLDADIYLTYSATEAPGATELHLHRNNRDQPLRFHHGKTAKLYVLNALYEQVPVGVHGEVYVEATGRIRGYLGQPGLTAEKFVPDVLNPRPHARLYKTGDRACYEPGGKIKFVGRIDFQVKIRGYRIELGEIETVLSQYPGVQETVVVMREDNAEDKRLVAYVVSGEKPFVSREELCHHLQKKLPEYMVPTTFVELEALPLSPNGKVDRTRLPKPEWASLRPQDSYVAPRTPTEKMLVEIWQAVLKVETIGIHDNFFELGGESLLATQVLNRIRDVSPVGLTLRHFFEMPSIAKLAQGLKALSWSTEGGSGKGEEETPSQEIGSI